VSEIQTDSLIWANWDQVSGEIGALMQRYAALPRHIAKKHLGKAMRDALRPGVSALKAATPVGMVMKANKKGVVKMRRSGELRRAATSKSRYIGNNRDGIVVGTLGYKYGDQSRKAIWIEFGTKRQVKRPIVQGVMREFKPQAAAKLTQTMAVQLEKAATELASGKAVGSDYRRKR
jgi:hypothetical protein